MEKINPNIDIIIEYFNKPSNPSHKQYLALRMFFYDKVSVSVIAEKTGYTKATIYSLVRDFKKNINNDTNEDPFFRELKAGRKEIDVFDIQKGKKSYTYYFDKRGFTRAIGAFKQQKCPLAQAKA